MCRIAIAVGAALLFIAPVTAAELTTWQSSETRSVDQTVTVENAPSRKPKKPQSDTSDYLVVTLTDASVVAVD